ncbi:hypothetical protein BV25DRAFT_1773159, partial [Artomyces pyxidatus]
SPASFLRLSRTCKIVHACVGGYIRRAFNIDRHLARWFADPAAFRALQARTTTLVSGSNALQFFERTAYPGADLDLFTPREHMLTLALWLLQCGYAFVPAPGQMSDADLGALALPDELGAALEREDARDRELDAYENMFCVIKVYTFCKAAPGGPGKPLKVQVIGSNVPPVAAVLHFHSTCVMNVISYSTAYSLYPRATFESRRALVCPTRGLEQGPALQKYASRGWDMLPASSSDLSLEPSFAAGPRWIDDEQSWVLQL